MLRMVVGSTLAMLGFTMFSYATLHARRRHPRAVHTSALESAAAQEKDLHESARLLPTPPGSQLSGKRLAAV